MNRCVSHVPIRTCVSCRSKKGKMELIRLVINKDNSVVIDNLKRQNGRGIYICNDAACMERFFKKRGLNV
ncbi:MAG: YlxR family protein [Desulfatiglans sp.]|nr:YlxR family protein [Desulfatiglans sp.]